MKSTKNDYHKVPILILFLGAILISCSGKSSPIDSALPHLTTESGIEKHSSAQMLLGAYDLFISDDHSHAEILPVRNTHNLGDSWATELSMFFIQHPCQDCFRIKSISLDEFNRVVLEFYIKHPFEPGDQSEPPTALNRDDVRIFDTRLVIAHRLGDGPEFPALEKKLSNTFVLNPNGYTDMIDQVYDRLGNREEDTHPYVLLFENPYSGNVNPDASTGFDNLLNASGHNVFNQGAETIKEVTLNLEPGQYYQLRLFIMANYGQSTIDFTQRLNPTYYLPEFNAKEPWKVDVVVESNSLAPGHTNSRALLLIRVWDWQHEKRIDPNLESLDSIRSSSDIESVAIEVPALFDGLLIETEPDVGGTGRGDSPLEYRFEIYNEKGASNVDIKGLVKVTDSRVPGLNESMSEDLIFNTGFGFLEFDIPAFRTYQYFELDFNTENIPPIAKFTTSPPGDPLLIGLNDEIQLDATSSYDIDGIIQTYEWDFNYDRETFRPQSGYTSATETWQYATPGIYRMALRVTDNGTPAISDIAYKWVDVHHDPSIIEPRLIGPIGNDCNNLEYSARNPIRVDGMNVYVPVGGFPTGTRYILASIDNGSTFSSPIQVPHGLNEASTQHIGGMDVDSNNAVMYLYFDEVTPNPISWMLLGKSPDGLTWGAGYSLRESTDDDYVTEAEFIFGLNDHEFVIFESIIGLMSGDARSRMNYIHRPGPPHSFQDRPITLEQSHLPPDKNRFRHPVAAVDNIGNVHVTYAKFTHEAYLIDPYSVMYSKISPDGDEVLIEPVWLNNYPNKTGKRHIAIAVDGANVYVVFSNYNILAQYSEISLVRSIDGGTTWSDPIMISDAPVPAVGIDHHLNIAVDHNSRLHVVWTDTRQSHGFRNIWYDYSDDCGVTWNTDYMIYGRDVPGDQRFPGIAIDYLNRVHVVWWNNDIDDGRGVWHTRFIH